MMTMLVILEFKTPIFHAPFFVQFSSLNLRFNCQNKLQFRGDKTMQYIV